jgi:glycosyltransferase involved in cell wall biosynthesis
VAEGLEAEYPAGLRDLASFEPGDVADLAARLDRLCRLDPAERAELAAAARRAAVRRWSWAGVAARLLAQA